MPAAAVIPAPLAYAKVAAVKKLVVEPWAAGEWCDVVATALSGLFGDDTPRVYFSPCYCEEIRVFKAGSRLNTSAWNNRIGLCRSCWFGDRSND